MNITAKLYICIYNNNTYKYTSNYTLKNLEFNTKILHFLQYINSYYRKKLVSINVSSLSILE